jgi:EmrB/QacA subfamily drug resistance transporter
MTAVIAPPGRPLRNEPDANAHRGLALGLLLLVQLMVVIDTAIVILALPSINRALHFSPANLQWVVSAYALAFGGFLLLGGRCADLLGRRRVLMAGVGVFSAASLVCGLATSSGMLITARAVEGLGAAFMAPTALSLIMTLFEEGPERNRALGLYGAVSGSGGAIGVLAGGMLTTWLSWGWIFFVNVPIGVLVLVGAPRLLPESRAELGHHRFDIPGALSVTAGLSLLVYAVVTTDTHPWGSARTVGLLVAAAALLASFVIIEHRSAAPLLPLSFFANRTASVADAIFALLGTSIFAMFFFLSLYMQQVLGYSAITSGLYFLVLAGGIIVFSGLAQRLVTKAGAKSVLAVGTAILAGGQVLFTVIPVRGHFASDLLPAFVIVAVGLGLAFVANSIAATTGVAGRQAGLASGLMNTSQQVGGAVGIAVTSTIALGATDHLLHQGAGHAYALTIGFHRAFAVTAGLAALGALLTLLLPGKHASPVAHDPTDVTLEPIRAMHPTDPGSPAMRPSTRRPVPLSAQEGR